MWRRACLFAMKYILVMRVRSCRNAPHKPKTDRRPEPPAAPHEHQRIEATHFNKNQMVTTGGGGGGRPIQSPCGQRARANSRAQDLNKPNSMSTAMPNLATQPRNHKVPMPQRRGSNNQQGETTLHQTWSNF